MIVADTSALVALALAELEANSVFAAIQDTDVVAVSATTLAETLIVARRRVFGDVLEQTLASFELEVVPVTEEFSRRVANAYDRWGKGIHPAKLNFADCFAYALAMERACPLLFVGNDFSQTDVAPALP